MNDHHSGGYWGSAWLQWIFLFIACYHICCLLQSLMFCVIVNFILILVWLCRHELAMFQSASTDLDYALVVCVKSHTTNARSRSVVAGRNIAHSFRQTHTEISIKFTIIFILGAMNNIFHICFVSSDRFCCVFVPSDHCLCLLHVIMRCLLAAGNHLLCAFVPIDHGLLVCFRWSCVSLRRASSRRSSSTLRRSATPPTTSSCCVTSCEPTLSRAHSSLRCWSRMTNHWLTSTWYVIVFNLHLAKLCSIIWGHSNVSLQLFFLKINTHPHLHNASNIELYTFVTLFFGKVDTHPSPRNANNIEPYTFVTLFFRESWHPPTPSQCK